MRIGERRLLAKRTERWQKNFNAYHPVVQDLRQAEARENRRAARIGIVVGALLHVLLFLTVFPDAKVEPRRVGTQPQLYQLRQVRFQPPKAGRRLVKPPTRPTAKKVPIPDPTPEDPEPIFRDAADTPEVDFAEVEIGDVLEVPDGPPGPSVSVYQVSGNVRAPQKLFTPDPVYSEEARAARIQGVVILQTIIDVLGNVSDIRVLKGLPSGLTEAATEAVSRWRFKPATLEGDPVPVYYIVTVSFSVQ